MKKLLISCLFIINLPIYSQWVELNSKTSPFIDNVFFADNQTGYADDAFGSVFKTTDSGNNWVLLSSISVTSYGRIFFVSGNTGYIDCGIGCYGYCERLQKTTNGGQSWDSLHISFGSPSLVLNELFFLNENTGYAACLYSCFKTIDGGISWSTILSVSGDEIHSIVFLNTNTGYAIGNHSFYKTTNGGQQWQSSSLSNMGASYLSRIRLFQQNIYIVGIKQQYKYGAIYQSTDQGESWEEIINSRIDSNTALLDVAIDQNLICAVGYQHNENSYSSGIAISSINNGMTWQEEFLLPGQYLNRVNLTKSEMFIVSANGDFMKKDRITGIQPGHGSIENFQLNQNYPNPFNPATVINYSLPKQSFVSLTIYDMQGKQIQTNSSIQIAGNHSVTFDGTNLSSGTYFYRIEAGEFTETKKMILIK